MPQRVFYYYYPCLLYRTDFSLYLFVCVANWEQKTFAATSTLQYQAEKLISNSLKYCIGMMLLVLLQKFIKNYLLCAFVKMIITSQALPLILADNVSV